MKRILGGSAVALLLLLTGCSAAPSRDEIADRFLTELSDSETVRDAMGDLADSVADDMLDGKCGSPAYEAGLTEPGTDPALFYAWRVTCSMFFEGDLTAEQLEETKQMVLERTVGEG